MSEKTSTLDGTGSPVILGKKYGYAQNSNGVTTTVIGVAEKFTPRGVTLKVISALRAVYSNQPEKVTYEKSKVTCKCLILFPIN